jgi:hypothetical protein
MPPSAAVLPHQEYDRLCAIKQAAVISINVPGRPVAAWIVQGATSRIKDRSTFARPDPECQAVERPSRVRALRAPAARKRSQCERAAALDRLRTRPS